jgi:predicted anti-sigma-YlaC factor YlaD
MTEKPTLSELLHADLRDPGCQAGFEVIDQYVELELGGKDPAETFPGVAAHLQSCPACRLDYGGILQAARDEA